MATIDVDRLLRYPKSWKLVPLYGVNADGTCCCPRGDDCTAPGKHPIHKNWAASASNDEDQIIEWFDGREDRNVGLLLGPQSGVIDIEFDDERGREIADKLLADVITPTYRSGRSVHRLFLWDDSLPDIQKRVVNGLEIRIGGGGKLTQSVLPPSRHHSGCDYDWLDGLSAEDVEIVAVPRDVFLLLYNYEDVSEQNTARSASAQKVYDQAFITEGERNTTMLSYACQQAKRSRDISSEEEQQHLYMTMSGVNAAKFRPPLDERELRKIHEQAIAYTQRDEVEATVEGVTYTQHGLERRGQQWYPGEWQLTVVQSDPPEYQLHVPAWQELTVDGTGVITMNAEQFLDANKMALAVFKATREICLTDQPRRWPKIWNGTPASKSSGGTIGLHKRLLDARLLVDPPAMRKRIVVIAEWFLERIENAEELREGQTDPDDSARPTKLPDGTVCVRWQKLWQDGILSGQIEKGEPERLSARLRLGKKHSRVCKTAHGRRLRFTCLGEDELQLLCDIAEVE